MDWPTATAGTALALSVIGGIAGGLASWRQRSNEKSNVVFEAMRSHMVTLASDNKEFRQRLDAAEARHDEHTKRINFLQVEVSKCEADKQILTYQVSELKRKVDSNGS